MTTLSGSPAASPALPRARRGPRDRVGALLGRWNGWHTGLTVLAAASAFITLWALQLGQRSEYYAAIALSMSQSWANWLFGAVDPAGTVSLDKIPGSYWVPAAFVHVFGFSTWSVDAPNAIATVLAVVLVAVTAKRLLSPTAGLLAGAAVAATPIVAAVARSNQPEAFFVLGLALVAWAATKALQRRSFGWLLTAGAFVALSFQMYMLEAWAVWPALAAAWLSVRLPWGRKLLQLLAAGVLSLALSLVWIAVVALVPASARPYVGGTYSNNPFEMVFGYNGLGRFAATSESDAYRSFTPPFSGDAGVLRLFNAEVAGQIAWLIPAALLAVVVLWLLRFPRPQLVFLGGWLVTFLVMFSAVAGMHQFYTASLALPIALLVGLAFALARSRDVLWPQLALIGTAALTALGIALYDPGYLLWVAIVQLALALVVGGMLMLARRARRRGAGGGRWVAQWWVAVLAGAALLLTPAAWAVDAMNHPSSINPIAGAASAGGAFGGRGGPPGGSAARGGFGDGIPPGAGGGGSAPQGGGIGSADASVLAYVQQNRGSASYLLATFGAQSAAGYITATDGDSVLPIGGFSSQDPAPTLDRFEQLVADGELRFVLMSNTGLFRTGGIGGAGAGTAGTGVSTSASSQIQSWVGDNCTLVASVPNLYDCAP